MTAGSTARGPAADASRRQLLSESLGVAVSSGAFGFVLGLAARDAGLTPLEAGAMSLIVFAGAAQFAAIGYLAAGLPWLPILVVVALLNARHLLYSAALAPRLRDIGLGRRAAMAHVLTDEAFALSAAHFHRLGRIDSRGYWIAATIGVFVPWNVATVAGALLGGVILDPASLGLDIVFPAAMAGLAVGLVTGRRELVAAGAGAVSGVLMSLAFGPGPGIVAGGLIGPAVAMLTPEGGTQTSPDSDMAGVPVDLSTAEADLADMADLVHPADPAGSERGRPT